MTYNPNFPESDTEFKTSPSTISTNFTQANNQFDVDHFKFNFDSEGAPYDLATSVDRGIHRKTTYVNLTGDPLVNDNERTVFAKTFNSTISPFTQINNEEAFQFSGSFIAGTNGETITSQGLHIKWGQVTYTNTGGSTQTFTFSGLSLNDFPSSTFQLLITLKDSTSNKFAVTNFSKTGFTLGRNTGSSNIVIRFLAMGI